MIVSTCRVERQRDIRRGYVLHITNLEDQSLDPETRALYLTGGDTVDIFDDEPPTLSTNPAQGLFGLEWVDPPPVKRGFARGQSRTIERTEPLHVSTGKAENEIKPEGLKKLSVENLEYAIDAVKATGVEAGDYRGAELVADQDRVGALIELLCEMGDDPVLTRAINKVLDEQQAAIRVRKP